MNTPILKEQIIASAVWVNLLHGVDISAIMHFLHPEYDFPDILYHYYPKDTVDNCIQSATHISITPAAVDFNSDNTIVSVPVEPCRSEVKAVDKIRPYLNALVDEGYITEEYVWIRGIGHTLYQAAYIARILHHKFPSVSQNAIGKIFGIKSISTYLAKMDTKENIKKPLESIFTKRHLPLE